ncbi:MULTISPECIES: ADP-ribosylglycohydrolase family protein [unclassified Brenneria]|uniref:ADP-ribosylglycohydrolase family protein n=1 Tax=unclassified Brenneria TaxID=2634434 RepID=UPI00155177B5|nr:MULTISPECIES: ADP-ribosylglycohydrolase family protein [unclassified Brenneria]MBJ7223358.1 ADP-ribosylglycohydrolase family protein [Brenneria sp. L3-3C-1]MEE3644598.1 ADP-ribosylglycohydrolase family protein [Brenneria sp. L3_3C_1]MEE3652160.1 ADP-ribosylglycohydrolase family protein [Brenneria sp. HEZEL_4_2_4]NPD02119.1 ADP-ribosylglycohydrolase family protein [Brenneria sp. hezel4-2-4]
MPSNKQNRINGALYGQMLGDAMGMPSELWPRTRIKNHFGWIDRFLPGPANNSAARYFQAAQYTDDTAMAIALADALIECEGRIDPTAIGEHLLKWALSFGAFEKNILGPASKAALTALRQGVDIHELENNGITNGAAMRISPLGCLLPPRSLNDFINNVALASSVTHKSDIAVAGAVAIAWAISRAIEGTSTWNGICNELPAVAQAAQNRRITTYSASLACRIELALETVKRAGGAERAMTQIYNLIGAGTDMIESVPATIAMVELAQTDPNRCAILCANLGGDTAAIGAMATAICGALNGVTSIAPHFKQQLDEVNRLDIDYYGRELLRLRILWEQVSRRLPA